MSWLVTWSKGMKNTHHAALITVLNTRAQKTDTEDTEEWDKPPESYNVKINFEVRGLIHIHMEDTWKAAI